MSLSNLTLNKIGKLSASVITIIFLLYLGYVFSDIIIMLAISFLIALIFNPLVTWLEEHGVNQLVSVLLIFLATGIVIFFALSVFVPKIIFQMNAISKSLNREDINSFIKNLEQQISLYLPFINSENLIEKINEVASSFLLGSINNLSDILTSIFSVVAISVIVPFMTFFLLKDKNKIVKGIINIVPNKYFEMSYWVMKTISHQLGRYVRGWILDAFLVGTLVAIGLTILGIKNSISIGLIAGIGHLIPYFGPVIGGLPAITISLLQFGDFSKLLSIVILFTIIYSFDSGYLQPKLFSMATNFHPLMIILLILIGGQLYGILGMLLAVPTATVIKTAAREIYYAYKNYKIIKT